MAKKVKDTISIETAMDNIAAAASLDMNGPIAIVDSRLITSQEEIPEGETPWLEAEGADPVTEILDQTYRALFQHVLETEEDPETLMELVAESAHKMDAFLASRGQKEPSITERKSFNDLCKLYKERFEKPIENVETVFEDTATVLSDKDYELFYIRNADGEPYYTPELLRHIRVNCQLGPDKHFEEDPLLKVRAMQDRDLHASASQIIHDCHHTMEDFFKISKDLEDNKLAEALGMACVALFLASNPRHLIQNTEGKSAFAYFEDFQQFLRQSMQTAEYQKKIAYPEQNDGVAQLLLTLTHHLCRALFWRLGGVKLESIGLIHRVMRQGVEEKQKKKETLPKGATFWEQLSLDDENYRTYLSAFPNGPVFKILDLVREEGDAIPFDPLIQGNLPSRLFELEKGNRKIACLHLPAPIRQYSIDKVEIADEFRGFLRASKKQKHLLVNLADRNSWKEAARSKSLERLQSNAEFGPALTVITLPNKVDLKSLRLEEGSSYFFPTAIRHEILTLANEMEKQGLTEGLHELIVLKCIELSGCTSFSFTSKDAVDSGATETAALYGLVQRDFSSKQEQDFLRWLLYTPALFIRERPVDIEAFNHTISLLAWAEDKRIPSLKEWKVTHL